MVDSLDSKRVRFSVYVGLGQVYADLHNFRLAHHYYDLAEQDPEPHLEYEEYHYLNSKGNCYYYEERYHEALTCFQEAYTVARRFNQPLFDALVEANLGEIYTLLGQYDSAHHYLDKSYAYFESNSTANEEAVFYLNSLQAALALRQNKLALVNHYLSRPFNPLHIGPNYIYLHNKRFMEYYAQKGDFEKAYHYKSIVEEYDDSLRNVRSLNNIAEIDYRYSQDTILLKRDVLIANNEMRLSQQRNTIILVVSLLVISVLLGILALAHARRKNERAYNRQVELVRSLRMENVRNRLSPHYLFNVLNTIMPAFKQYADLSHLLKLFIQVLRDNLQVSEQIAVELQDEIGRVKNYIALRRETNPDKVSAEWCIDKHVPLKTLIPSMGIQIPVENALKYAFDPDSDEERLLTIQISTEGLGIRIVVRDNGRGYDPGKYTGSERSTGNGLKMLFGITEVLNTKNTEKMTFDIRNIALTEPSEHGTQVTLFVPYHYQFKL
ncbi:MAG: tetratricopeptide repeat protein [Bacteroides sp.]|nr:tetratricopeptide repeat protein [Bacteroides sp.]